MSNKQTSELTLVEGGVKVKAVAVIQNEEEIHIEDEYIQAACNALIAGAEDAENPAVRTPVPVFTCLERLDEVKNDYDVIRGTRLPRGVESVKALYLEIAATESRTDTVVGTLQHILMMQLSRHGLVGGWKYPDSDPVQLREYNPTRLACLASVVRSTNPTEESVDRVNVAIDKMAEHCLVLDGWAQLYGTVTITALAMALKFTAELGGEKWLKED